MAQIQFSLIKKIYIYWTSRTLANTPLIPRPITCYFCWNPQLRPSTPFEVDIIFVSPLKGYYLDTRYACQVKLKVHFSA